TRSDRDWSSDVCSSDLDLHARTVVAGLKALRPSAVPREWLSAKGDSVRPDPLVGLGLSWPADRTRPTLYLVGNSTVRNGRGDGEIGRASCRERGGKRVV